MAAATKRLQDAQGAEAVAEAKLQSLRDRGVTDAGRLAAAEEAVTKARRSQAAAVIALAAAQDTEHAAASRAVSDTDRMASSADKAGQSFKVGLIPALAALAPAAVPIAAVAGGALLGLLPVAATVALGIKGIENQMKAGALQGTQFADSVNSLKGELTTLEQSAAGGLMSGINQALAASGPLFSTVNQDVVVMAGQLGNIVAGAAPALLTILTDLNPLFVTFGQLLTDGATRLEHWAQSSTGISSFVAYVQAELPTVMQVLGNVVTLIAHLAQAAAPFGGALLNDLNLFVRALDSIPIGVLQTAIPLAVSLYAALKAGQGVSAIVNAVNAAVKSVGESLQLTGPQAEAAAAQVEASNAREAAAVAEGAAQEAEAFQAKQAEARQWGAVYDETAAQVAAAARAEATALAASADEAQLAADKKAAAARKAAAATEEEGAASAGALGPLAAVGVGVLLLTTMLGNNSDAAQKAAQAQDSYADSVKQSTDALNAVNIAQTNTNLASNGALRLLDGLHQANFATSISYDDLAQAVNGTDAQFDALTGQLKGHGAVATWLVQHLEVLRTGLSRQIDQQKSLNAANQQATQASNAQATALRDQAAVLGASVPAYQAAKKTADDNTASTKAQTLAYQLENNAVALVNQALQSLAGQNLSNAQAQTAMEQAILTATSALKSNKGALSEHTTAGLADRQAIEGAVSAIRAKMTAEAQATGSTEKATAQYHANAQALLEQIGKLDGTSSAAYKYAQQLLKVPPVVKTAIELQNAATAEANLKFIQQQIAEIPSYKTVTVDVQMKGNLQSTYNSQVPQHATGTGAGGLPDGWSWVGDPGPASELVHKQGPQVDVFSHAQSVAIAGQMGIKVPAFATGTGSANTALQALRSLISSIGQSPAKQAQINLSNITGMQVVEQILAAVAKLNAALRDGFSVKQVQPLRDQVLALAAEASKELGQLKIKVDSTDLAALQQSLTGSASQIKTAFGNLVQDVEQLGVPASRLNPLIASANKIADQLGAANAKLAADIQARAAEAQKIAQVIDQFNIATDGFNSTTGTDTGIGGMLGDLQKQVNSAAEFGADLQLLKNMGLNSTSLEQLAEAGPTDQTMQRIQELLAAGPGQIQQINDLVGLLAKDAGSVGDQLAGDLYNAGISADQGLIKGLQQKESDIYAQVKKIADGIVAELQKDLKIHSPSLVMRDLGQFVGAGLALGMNDTHPLVLSASKSLANLTLPKLTGPARGAGAAASGPHAGDAYATRDEVARLRSDLSAGLEANARLTARLITEGQRELDIAADIRARSRR